MISSCDEYLRRSPVAYTIVVAVSLALALGGCPADPESDGAGLDPDSGGGVLEPWSSDGASPDGSSGVGEWVRTYDASLATPKGTPLIVTLTGQSSSGQPLTFSIVSPPSVGTLSRVDPVDDSKAEVLYTPPAGLVGVVQFSYRAETGSLKSDPSTVRIVVYPNMQFAVEPVDGRRDLTVRAYTYTVTGDALPEGTCEWSFDGEVRAGPMDTHWEIWHTFRTGGSHIIRLSLTMGALTVPIGCGTADRATVTVWPEISGRIYDGQGDPVPDVSISVDGSDLSDTTGPTGTYALSVPYGSSGVLRPRLQGYEFAPEAWSFSNLKSDLGDVDFRATRSLLAVTISGYVRTADGDGMADVTLTATNGGGSTVTNARGFYAFSVGHSWSGTITPSAPEYTFDPPSRQYSNLCEDLSSQGFTGTLFSEENNPPVLSDQADVTDEDTSETLTLNGYDADEDDLTFEIVSAPVNGQLGAVDNSPADSATVPYTPNPDFNGVDTFTFMASDGRGGESDTVTFTITVHPVNDPPTFTNPGNQIATPGGQLDVAITDVSPGPPDEADQTVTFSATSSDQSVIPDANLVFSGSPPTVQLSIAPIAAGPATITITAVDDGGTDRDGWDSAQASFVVNVVTGPTVSGTVSLVETAGARPPIGQQRLAFTGSGDFTGVDCTVTTSVDGYYLAELPEGWTGTVEVAEPDCMLLLDPANRWVFGDEPDADAPPVTESQVLDLTVWTAPIGIPMPEFGIKGTHYMYADQRFDFDGDGQLEPGEEYPDAGNGPYTHYVDNTHPDATDTNSPYGTPDEPRLTIPTNLPPGSVVEVHGGPYAYSNPIRISGAGTASQPIFVRGGDSANKPVFPGPRVAARGAYIIVENLDLDGDAGSGNRDAQFSFEAAAGSAYHHLALRHSSIHNTDAASALWVNGALDNPHDIVHHIVVYDNDISDMGDWQAQVQWDRHCLSVGRNARQIWILDNQAAYNQGDALQVRFQGHLPNQVPPQFIYVGRNDMHHNQEDCIDLKVPMDVVVSQNHLHGIRAVADGSGNGGVAGAHNDGWSPEYPYPDHIWFLYNEVYDAEYGFNFNNIHDGGDADARMFVIGNVFYDLIAERTAYTALREDSAWGQGWAIRVLNRMQVLVANNVIYDCDLGISGGNGRELKLYNNIISNLTQNYFNKYGAHPYQVFIYASGMAAASDMPYNLLWQGGDSVRIHWGGATHVGVAAFQAATGKGEGCVEGDPLFVDPAGLDGDPHNDYELLSGSPAIDAGFDLLDDPSVGLVRFRTDAMNAGRIDRAELIDRIINDLRRRWPPVDDPGSPNTGSGVIEYCDMGAFEHQPE